MAGEFAFMADWDLDAVVRGSCCNHISAAAAADLQPSSFNFDSDSFHDNNSFPFASSSMDRLMLDDDYTDLDGLLEGLYQPFCNQQLSSLTTTAPPLVMAAPPTEPSLKLPPASPVAILDLSSASSSSASPSNNISAAKLRKRRNQQKRVVEQVREEGISSDKWAWRKYGQKPIKGSPYPRSYYRCSSLKGCPARKQVERSTSDPSIFIITYTSEHSHAHPTRRNSLAGSTRVRNLVSSKETVANYSEAATPIALVEGDKHSPPSTASVEEELMLVKEEDEGGVLFEDGILYQSSSDVDFVGCDDVSFSDALYPGVAGGLDGMFMNRW